jgi:hypothetical protein
MALPNPRGPDGTGYVITHAGRTIRIYLDPALNGQDTPLRRALRQAGLLDPRMLTRPATTATTNQKD